MKKQLTLKWTNKVVAGLQNQEVMTAGALRDKGSSEELTQKVAELQEQVCLWSG